MARTSEKDGIARAATRRRSGMVLRSVRPVVYKVAHQRGLVVWDLAFVREAGDEVLRVAVDRPGGIDSGDVAKYSEALSKALDAADAVPGDARYYLQVSSPGAERKLKTPEQFRVCAGRFARITFRSGREPLEGTIGQVSDDGVEITDEAGGRHDVEFTDVSTAKLTVRGA